MRSARRLQLLLGWLLWPVLLAALLLPAGLGHVDLCQCRAGEHGALCSAPAQPTCCGKKPRAAEPERPCEGCPSLDLASTVTPRLTPAGADLSVAPAVAPAPTWDRALEPARVGPSLEQPRPPPRRLHLLLGVFRL